MQISTLPMADGSQATYIKGSRHLVHDGVVYLNYDKKEHSPHIFTEDAIGKKTDNGLIKVRTAYSTVVLKEAETMAIPVKDSATCATFVQGSMQILYGGDVYLQLDSTNFAGGLAYLQDGALRIPRWDGGYCTFTKQSDSTLKKRKRLDEQAFKEHVESEKRANAMRKHASKAAELAQQVLDGVQKLMALEAAARSEAGTRNNMFEDEGAPLSSAAVAVRAMLSKAEAKFK